MSSFDANWSAKKVWDLYDKMIWYLQPGHKAGIEETNRHVTGGVDVERPPGMRDTCE